jgi:hypothetical protein
MGTQSASTINMEMVSGKQLSPILEAGLLPGFQKFQEAGSEWV